MSSPDTDAFISQLPELAVTVTSPEEALTVQAVEFPEVYEISPAPAEIVAFTICVSFKCKL